MSSASLAIDMIVVAAGETRLAAYVEQCHQVRVFQLCFYYRVPMTGKIT
jgi:hypothetical protein